MNKTIKTGVLLATILLLSNQHANAQFGKKLKEALSGKPTTTETKNESSSSGTKTTDAVFTPFQKENLGKILFIGKEKVNVEQIDETAADFITEVELGKPLTMRTYLKGGSYNYESEGKMHLDVRYTVDGISFTNYDFTKYVYNFVESAPNRNTFGNFLKFENFMPINSIVGMKATHILTATLIAPQRQYWANLTAPEDAFRFFLSTKLKSYMTPGKTFTVKVELYKTDEITYKPSKDATRVIGEVYATGEIKMKVTDLIKNTDNTIYRMFTEGLVDKAAADGAAKQIALKFPSTVKKVHKVFFTDGDYKVTMGYQIPLNRSIEAWIYFENTEGHYFVTLTKLTYLYQGGGYSNTPELMSSGISGATFPVFGNAIK